MLPQSGSCAAKTTLPTASPPAMSPTNAAAVLFVSTATLARPAASLMEPSRGIPAPGRPTSVLMNGCLRQNEASAGPVARTVTRRPVLSLPACRVSGVGYGRSRVATCRSAFVGLGGSGHELSTCVMRSTHQGVEHWVKRRSSLACASFVRFNPLFYDPSLPTSRQLRPPAYNAGARPTERLLPTLNAALGAVRAQRACSRKQRCSSVEACKGHDALVGARMIRSLALPMAVLLER